MKRNLRALLLKKEKGGPSSPITLFKENTAVLNWNLLVFFRIMKFKLHYCHLFWVYF